jgi:hypothetical protein
LTGEIVTIIDQPRRARVVLLVPAALVSALAFGPLSPAAAAVPQAAVPQAAVPQAAVPRTAVHKTAVHKIAAADTCPATPGRIVVGAPDYANYQGGAEVRDSSGGQVIDRAAIGQLPGPTSSSEEFGYAVARVDLGAGACQLLIVGEPQGFAFSGRVYLAFDGPGGFGTGQQTRVLTPPVPMADGDFGTRFGESLAVTPRKPAVAGVTDVDLWVGAPHRDIGSTFNAGAVERYRLTYDSRVASPELVVQHLQTITEDSPGIPSSRAAGDQFGQVLTPALTGSDDQWGVLIGVPMEDVGRAVDAGMVVSLSYTGDGTALGRRTVRGLTQGSSGVAGKAESYDFFGSAVVDRTVGSPARQVITVGTPGEDYGTIKDAGAVQDTEGLSLAQRIDGLEDRPERIDRFGASLAWARLPRPCDTCPLPDPVLVVGVPGEDIGTIRDAGAAQFGKTLLWQGKGFDGAAETGDLFGEKMASQANSSILISAPSEDLDGLYNAGLVYSIPRTATVAGLLADPVQAFTFAGGAIRAARYGAALGR